MTVNATARRSGPYTANGTNRLFDFAFKITDADQLKIVVQDDLAGTNAVEYTSGYTIPDPTDIGSDNGGTLSFPTLPTGPLAAGKIVFILSNAAYSQPAAIGNEGAFYPETHEEAFDRLEIQIQQLVELASRAVTAPTGQTGAQYIATLLLQGAGYATAAAASATAANGSAVAAAASAAGALSAFNNFRDVYLGAFAVAPTTDIDGSALEAGDLYYDTVGQAMKVWIGASWVAAYVSGSGYAATANNLSDLASATAALTNLGLTANGKSLVTAANYAAMMTLLGAAALASPAFTGNPTAPTQAAADNSTKLATTAYVDRASGQTLIAFYPVDDEPPAANYATFDVRNGHPILTFPDAVVYAAIFTGVLPRRYSGGGLTVLINWMNSTTSTNKVCFSATLERVDVGTTDLDADSFGTQVIDTVGIAANATSGIQSQTSIALTAGANMDSAVAGDCFRLKITRETGQANDTQAGDAQIVSIEVKET